MTKTSSAGALNSADVARLSRIRAVSEKVQGEFAQYLTPPETAMLAASMLSDTGCSKLRCLDLGAGTGMLSVALSERYEGHVHIDAVESEQSIAEEYEQQMSELGIDHTLWVGDALACDSLFGPRLSAYDRVILNPPYKKMSASDARADTLPARSPNLYAAFMMLACSHLAEGGECVAIVPRSWTNGQYFTDFRRWLLGNYSLDAMHVYGRRDEVFSETDVLQEIMIVRLSKRPQTPLVRVTSSNSRSDGARVNEYPYSSLVDNSNTYDVRIEPASNESLPEEKLFEAGFCPSTGKVVDFRSRNLLLDAPRDPCVPLLYPCNLHDGVYAHPVEGGKAQWLSTPDSKSRAMTIPAGSYVAVKRFSSKEERRRLHVSYLDLREPTALENHFTFVHAGTPRRVKPLDPDLARGLTLWMNATQVDEWFRGISGSTQVNARDLKSMPVPSRSALRELAREWPCNWSQENVDHAVERVCR